jgi:hypothetical protein
MGGGEDFLDEREPLLFVKLYIALQMNLAGTWCTFELPYCVLYESMY